MFYISTLPQATKFVTKSKRFFLWNILRWDAVEFYVLKAHINKILIYKYKKVVIQPFLHFKHKTEHCIHVLHTYIHFYYLVKIQVILLQNILRWDAAECYIFTVQIKWRKRSTSYNGTAHNRHQCRKTAVLSCHIFLINSGVEKMNNI